MGHATFNRRPASGAAEKLALVTLSAAYATHGFGYAATVAGLSFSAGHYGFDTGAITVILLVVCLGAATGSVLADLVAEHRDSRWALTVGLALQVAGLACVVLLGPTWLYVAGVILYGVGLGAVDASAAMQGVIIERRRTTPVMGRMFAFYTGAGILGALVTSASLATSLGFRGPLLVALAMGLVLIMTGPRFFATATIERVENTDRTPLPRGPVWLFGSLIFAAYVVDTAVSTWSTPHLHDTLNVSASHAPLGYAAYLGVMLCSRAAVDAVVARVGVLRMTVAATLVGIAGLAVVLTASRLGPAVAGLALCAVVSGSLVPIAFTGAGASAPARPDAMIARVNLFNYAGALVGAVLTGAAASLTSTRAVFVIPLATLVVVLPMLLRARRSRSLVISELDAEARPVP